MTTEEDYRRLMRRCVSTKEEPDKAARREWRIILAVFACLVLALVAWGLV